jgi:hypothetical protein
MMLVMGLLLASYFGLAMVALLSIAGPLLAGRWLADREEEPDPEQAALEAYALMLLAGKDLP